MRRKISQRALTEVELIEYLAKPLHVVTKAGGLRNGAELGHGTIWHLAPANGCRAICGATPSIMFTTWGNPSVTCPRCAKLRDKYRPKVMSADETRTMAPAF